MPKVRLSLFAVVLFALGVRNTFAATSISFSAPFSGSIASNFANAAGTVTDGMNWGIIVHTGASGSFSVDANTPANAYTPFNISTGGFLSTSTGVTSDYYFPASNPTQDDSAFSESGGTAGGHGTITNITGVPYGSPSGISLNQVFALVWFSSNSAAAGARYGFFTDSSFLIPSDGSNVDLSAKFAGTDPIRSALQVIAVPEPTILGMGAMGMLVLARRRYRR